MKKKLIGFVALLFLLTYCNPSTSNQSEVRVRLPQDPENLNPVSYTNIHGLQIINLLFQSLLTTTGTNAQLLPLLAQSLPIIEQTDTSTLLTYQLRTEATWDNRSPIQVADIIYSMKAIKCPLLNNEKMRMRYQSVRDVVVHPVDSTKVVFVCDKQTANPDRLTGALFILPKYLFDPQDILQRFSITSLDTHYDSLSKDPFIIKYAQIFNSENFTRNHRLLNGSGGYILANWNTGQSVLVQKKPHWWAETLSEKPDYITANPATINFQIIPENTTALMALKNNTVDVFSNIPANDFVNITKDASLSKNYTFLTPETYDFTYIGINSRSEKFKERLTRQAIMHLLDIDNIILATQKGFAVHTTGPFKPDDPYYHSQIKLFGYSLQKAVQLLQQAGWEKEQDQWVKIVGEEKIPLSINLQFRAGNTEFESIGLIFKESASKISIPVDIQPVEGSTLTNNLRTHEFEMFIRSISGSPNDYDFKSILHTESAVVDGNNYTGFGTPESDALLETINHTTDEQEKAKCLKRFQEILYEEANTIFLYTLKNRIAVSNRLSNIQLLASKYGYDVSALTLSSP